MISIKKTLAQICTWIGGQDYSTNEVRTGKKWIDGKPIYRKVITFPDKSLVPKAWVTLADVSNLNIESTVSLTLYRDAASSRYVQILTVLEAEIYNGLLRIWSGYEGIGDGNIYSAIIEYTKTTDTGGGGLN